MADIPPDIAASSAQAGFTAREVGKERAARRAGQAVASSRQVKSLDEAGSTVDTTDGDTAVFSDSEGAGSEGRSTGEESPETDSPDEASLDKSGITRGEDGSVHLDLEA